MQGKRRKGQFYALFQVNLKILGAVLLALALCAAAMITVQGVTVEEGVEVPIVMYHSLLKDPARQGQYVISPADFEEDLDYLEQHGYTTVLMEDLIAYTQGGALPEKPVLLTFDDGYYNNYLYAFEIAKRHGGKFLISPIGVCADQYTENPDENAYYSHATWPQLREMWESGLVEVQNHTYDLHKNKNGRIGAKRAVGETEEQYRLRLTQDVQRAQDVIEARVGIRPTTFVYPFGAVSEQSPEIVKEMGFSATLSCEEKVSRITRDPEALYGLGRYLRASGISSQEFFERRMKLNP